MSIWRLVYFIHTAYRNSLLWEIHHSEHKLHLRLHWQKKSSVFPSLRWVSKSRKNQRLHYGFVPYRIPFRYLTTRRRRGTPNQRLLFRNNFQPSQITVTAVTERGAVTMSILVKISTQYQAPIAIVDDELISNSESEGLTRS